MCVHTLLISAAAAAPARGVVSSSSSSLAGRAPMVGPRDTRTPGALSVYACNACGRVLASGSGAASRSHLTGCILHQSVPYPAVQLFTNRSYKTLVQQAAGRFENLRALGEAAQRRPYPQAPAAKRRAVHVEPSASPSRSPVPSSPASPGFGDQDPGHNLDPDVGGSPPLSPHSPTPPPALIVPQRAFDAVFVKRSASPPLLRLSAPAPSVVEPPAGTLSCHSVTVYG
jgi:hypothetical protein